MIYGKWITVGAISLNKFATQLENGWDFVFVVGHFSD